VASIELNWSEILTAPDSIKENLFSSRKTLLSDSRKALDGFVLGSRTVVGSASRKPLCGLLRLAGTISKSSMPLIAAAIFKCFPTPLVALVTGLI